MIQTRLILILPVPRQSDRQEGNPLGESLTMINMETSFTDKIYSDNPDHNEAISVCLTIVLGALCMLVFVFIAGIIEADSQIFSFLAYGTIPATLIALLYIALTDPHRPSEKNSRSIEAPTEEHDSPSEIREKYIRGEINEAELEHELKQVLKDEPEHEVEQELIKDKETE